MLLTQNKRQRNTLKRPLVAAAVATSTAVSLLLAGVGTSSAATLTASAAAKTVTIGGVFSETGPTASPGQFQAASAYFKNANAHGGIDGTTVKFIGLDDQGSSSNALTDYKTLIQQDHVAAIVVGDDTEFYGVATSLENTGVPMVGCVYATPCYANKGMYPVEGNLVFTWAAAAATYIASEHIKSVSQVTVNNVIGLASAKAAAQDLSKVGVKVAFSTTFEPTTADFTGLAEKAAASNAGATEFIPSGEDIPQYMQAVVQQNIATQVFVSNYDAAYPKLLGAGASKKFFATNGQANLGAGAAGVQAETIVKKYYPSIDLQGTVFGTASYTAAEAIGTAIKKLNGKPATGANIISSLNSFKKWSGTFSAPLTYNGTANANPSNCMQVAEDVNQAWILPGGKRFVCFASSAT